ncbi:cell division protein FtsQ/DivIB [Plantactinospora sp. GCM10030261]|uniref:cell division protein FtsQ/DivIB n=1 Tax=Plantactinospora sp. GCM10030261 TaxID=3273420 RepID=UPI00360C00D2
MTEAGSRRWRLVRASNAAVSPTARRFMRRARRRRLRAALPWLASAGVVAVLAVAGWIVVGTGAFGVREVRVAGADLLSDVEVRTAAAVPAGVPLARVDLAAVRERVAALPQVDRVTVGREWPHTLRVEIVERTPLLAVPREDGFAVLDAEGVVFQTVRSRPPDVPVARIAQPGPTDPATHAAVTVFGSLTTELRQRTAELTAASPARITLLLTDGRTVVWGDASQGEAKAKVAVALLAGKGDVIDVSAPDVVTIR